jgi:hypothetical protein
MIGASPERRVGPVLPMGRSSPPQWVDPVLAGPPNHRACHSNPVEVAVVLKKVVAWLIVAFVVFYVIQAPEQSAQIVKNAGNALGDAASSFANFIGSLV